MSVLVLATAGVLANLLDIFGLALVGVVATLALSPEVEIPFVSRLMVSSEGLIFGLLALALVVFLLKTGFGIAISRHKLLYLAKIETIFAEKIAAATFSNDLTRLKSQSLADIQWAILRSSHIAFPIVLGQAMTMVAEVSLAVGVVCVLLVADWPTALGATLYFLCVLFVFQFFSRHVVTRAGTELTEGSVEVNQAVANLSNAFREISVLSKTEVFISSLSDAKAKTAKASAKMGYLAGVPRQMVEAALVLGVFAMMSIQLAGDNEISNPAILGMTLFGSLRIMSALLPLQRAFMAIKYEGPAAIAAQDALQKIREASGEPRRSPEPASLSVLNGSTTERGHSIVFRDLVYLHADGGSKAPALKNVSLEIMPGQFVAVIGPSGAGKSTLVELVLGLRKATSGSVWVSDAAPNYWRHADPGSISYVPQKPGLISGTIEANIALGVPREDVDSHRLAEAIRAANLTELMSQLPEGVHSSLGNHSDSLSGGQLQRLGIARALYFSPRLLVLDEATSALDAETEATITESLDGLRGRTTVIVVAHRLSTVQKADKIFLLDQGELIASGSFQQLWDESDLVKRHIELMSVRRAV